MQWYFEIRVTFCSDLAEDHYDQSKHPFDALQRRTDLSLKTG
jgi:hypothetical protein